MSAGLWKTRGMVVSYVPGERTGKRSGVWLQSDAFSFVPVDVEVVLDVGGGEVLQAVFAKYNSLYCAAREHEGK